MKIENALIKELSIVNLYNSDYQLKLMFTDTNNEVDYIQHLFESEIISMYHCLAKECNNLFKCNYEYSEDIIYKCAKDYNKYKDSNTYYYRWELAKTYTKDVYEVRTYYNSYGMSSGTIYNLYWDKLRIISFVNALKTFLDTHDVHRIAYEGEKKSYIFHYSVGIGSRIHPFYHDVAVNDIDLSTESLNKVKKIKGKEMLDTWSEKAMPLYINGEEYIKFSFDTHGINFYVYKDTCSTRYAFPDLPTLKQDDRIASMLISNGVDEKIVMEWVNGINPMPTFSFLEILKLTMFATFVQKLG
jgi:hypothetical protein